MSTSIVNRFWPCFVVVVALVACSNPPEGSIVEPELSIEELMDPQACKECHPRHFDEWQMSMHAYAAEDPVFIAMNKRGQRETGGELGDFCVRCHAPVALALGLTEDGLNLDEVPDYARGVTCWFCHTAGAVTGTHNAALQPADDASMRGGIKDPVPNKAHYSTYSPLHDRQQKVSSNLCGVCHDIVTPKGVHLERTFAEWKDSLFADPRPGRMVSCGRCHMQGRDDLAATMDGVGIRRVHDHTMAGVDIALSPWFGEEEHKAKVLAELAPTVFTPYLCVHERDDTTLISAQLENVAAGHSWPSGANQDRRAWVEIKAYDDNGEIVYQNGVVAEGQALTELGDDVVRFGDRTYKEDGSEAHMFWDVASYETKVLRAPTALPGEIEYTEIHEVFEWEPAIAKPARVTLKVFIRPVGLDVIDDLIGTGDLEPEIRERIPTFELELAAKEWTSDMGACSGL